MIPMDVITIIKEYVCIDDTWAKCMTELRSRFMIGQLHHLFIRVRWTSQEMNSVVLFIQTSGDRGLKDILKNSRSNFYSYANMPKMRTVMYDHSLPTANSRRFTEEYYLTRFSNIYTSPVHITLKKMRTSLVLYHRLNGSN